MLPVTIDTSAVLTSALERLNRESVVGVLERLVARVDAQEQVIAELQAKLSGIRARTTPRSAVSGARLKELLAARKMTQAELSRRAGVSTTTIRRLRNGKSRPRARTLERLAAALKVSVADLSDGDPRDGDSPLGDPVPGR